MAGVAGRVAGPRAGPASAIAAARGQLGLVALLLLTAAGGWWWTAGAMQGMDAGPWTGLGGLGWWIGVWAVMMGAMMFPSVAPTVALYRRMTRERDSRLPLLFVAGYLVIWVAAGLAAYVLARVGAALVGDVLAWNRAGRWFSAATLLAAALYELTPLKAACLGKCRSPLGFLLGAWRDGPRGALAMGARHGAWCLGCCWALMASLFALGVMSITWMTVVAALIAVEKLLPHRRVAVYGTAVILLAVGVLLAAAPDQVPGMTIPGAHAMGESGSMAPGGSMGMGP